MPRPLSIEEHQLKNQYCVVRDALLSNGRSDSLDRPLAHWAAQGDSSLPFALLGRRVSELLRTPFEQITLTPGIGIKKIHTLLMLLKRVESATASKKRPTQKVKAESLSPEKLTAKSPFQSLRVSEVIWDQWRETVRRFGLEQEKLGRLTPSLQALPTNTWELPLAHYLNYSVAEIRNLKAHGAKRIRGIFEVFHCVHQTLGEGSPAGQLTVRLTPSFVIPLEQWLSACADASEGPSADEVKASLATPLVRQIEVDCGSAVSRLVAGRWGLLGEPQSAREQAKRIKVTRARIYQQFEEVQKAIYVRWPEGVWHLGMLPQRLLQTRRRLPGGYELIKAIAGFCFQSAESLRVEG